VIVGSMSARTLKDSLSVAERSEKSFLTVLTVLTVLPFSGCARMGPPPGGPPDKAPPTLVSTYPESLGVYPGFKGSVDFQFDETLSEGGTPNLGTGTSELERLVLVSPSQKVPDVGWHRSRLSVKPGEGFRPNRVYRVELLPGVKDIRNNAEDTTVVVTFTTGAPLPTARLQGRVIDWPARQPARLALIQALLMPDSLPYLILTDSAGRYDLEPLPAGRYLVFAVVDQNHNRRLESRELFDSVTVGEGVGAVPALWLQPHDTVPPRIQAITLADSTGALVQFTGPLDPYQPPPFGAVRLLQMPDSVVVEGATLVSKAVDDSLRSRERAQAAKADSLAGKVDTAAPKPAVRPVLPPGVAPKGPRRAPPDTAGLAALLAQRPPLQDRLMLRVQTPFVPGGKYVVEISNLRGLGGATGNVRGGLAVPEPKPARTDSTARPPTVPPAASDTARPK
jgi:hypothetical protein